MTLPQRVIFFALVVPVLAFVCLSVVEHRREPWRDRPMIDATGSGGG